MDPCSSDVFGLVLWWAGVALAVRGFVCCVFFASLFGERGRTSFLVFPCINSGECRLALLGFYYLPFIPAGFYKGLRSHAVWATRAAAEVFAPFNLTHSQPTFLFPSFFHFFLVMIKSRLRCLLLEVKISRGCKLDGRELCLHCPDIVYSIYYYFCWRVPHGLVAALSAAEVKTSRECKA